MACCSSTLLGGGGLLLLAFILFKLFKYYQDGEKAKKLKKWSDLSQDKLILHMFNRSSVIPSASPFVLKLETYLRAAKIPFEIDFSDPLGPKGKSPWISYRGVNMGDSQLIIEFLNKKFDIDFNKNYTASEKAIAFNARILLETHFIWGLAKYRWVEGNPSDFSKIVKNIGYLQMIGLRKFVARAVQKSMNATGIGAHSPEEFVKMMKDDLVSISALLGTKSYFLGEEICEEDFAIFAQLAQIIYVHPESEYGTLISRELPNLKEFVERMRSLYWTDWNEICSA